MIIIVTRRVRLKEFTHEELGIEKKEIENEGIPVKFIVFQNMSMLYFIPFVPDQRIYAFLGEDGKTYVAPEYIKDFIELECPVKNPWYMYIGVVLFPAAAATIILMIIF